MLKMTVSPLDNRNNNMPNSTPLMVEITINSSTMHSLVSGMALLRGTNSSNRKIRSTPAQQPESKVSVPAPDTRRGGGCVDYYGRFILQVVGTMVCGVSILDTRCQPQPVFSSSNVSLSVR